MYGSFVTMNRETIEAVESREDYMLITFEGEGPDFDERTRKELNETPQKREVAVRQLRERLEQVTDFKPKTDDDRFLLRFLRARKFDVEKSYKLIENFYGVRLQDVKRYVPRGLGPKDCQYFFELKGGTILKQRSPVDGTVILLLRFGDWTPDTQIEPVDFYTPAYFGGESIIDNPEVQVNGFTAIFDLKGLQYSWLLRFATPDYISRILAFCQESYPIRIKKLHFVNHSLIWNIGFAVAKPFIKRKLSQRYHFHGMNMDSLHKFVPKEVLPEELGGLTGPLEFSFYEHIFKYHDTIVKNSYYGYDV